MNAADSLAVVGELAASLAAGVVVVVALAALASRLLDAAAWQRALWQACTVGLAVLALGEATGVFHLLTVSRVPADASTVVETTPLLVSRNPASEASGASPPAVPLEETEPPGDVALPAEAEEPAGWWPAVLWLAGTAVVAGRIVLARLLLVVFCRQHRPVSNDALAGRVRDVAARLGLRRRVRVLEAPGLVGPVAFGVVRPTVALPVGFAEDFDAPRQEVMLAHELAHLRGRDPAWHLLADLVTAALWWHPLAWWARHRLRAASEAAADEASLVVADGPGMLATCLVELGGRLVRARSPGWLRMAGPGFRSSLGRRVERLLRLRGTAWRPPGRVRAFSVLSLGPMALVAAAVLATGWARPAAPSEGDLAMTTAQQGWRRSVAGILVLYALGTSGDTALAQRDPFGGGDEKPAPRRSALDPSQVGIKPASEPGDGAVREGGEKDLKDLATDDLAGRLEQLEAQRAKLKQELAQVEAELARLRKVETEPKDASKKLADAAEKLKAGLQTLAAEQAQLSDELKQRAARRTRVFRLRHRDPEVVRDAVAILLGGAPAMAGGEMGGPGGGFGMPTGGPGGGRPAGGPMMGMRPGGMGGPPGGMMSGMGSMGAAPSWRLAADRRSRSLIVRGSERDLQLVADLVAVLDLPADEPMPKVKNLTAFRLRFANAQNLVQVLAELEMDVRAAPVDKNLLIVAGPEATRKEIAEVIEALDVEGAPGRK